MIRWMGIQAEIDLRPGGVYRLDPNGRDVIRGEYVEVVPNRRVVFTWGWENPSEGMAAVPAGSTRVEIDLEPHGKGTHASTSYPSPIAARRTRPARYEYCIEQDRTIKLLRAREPGDPRLGPCATAPPCL
jgi:uncharacterized protein YndB with AHSA1/START domain